MDVALSPVITSRPDPDYSLHKVELLCFLTSGANQCEKLLLVKIRRCKIQIGLHIRNL